MTTIVTRLYPDAKTADKAVAALKDLGMAEKAISVVGAGGGAEAELVSARVPEASAAAYAGALEGDRKVVVARAPFAPIGLAMKAIKAMNALGSIDAGVANENAYVAEQPRPELFTSVDKGHSLMFTRAAPGYSSRIGLQSAKWGMRMTRGKVFTGKSIIRRPASNSVIKGGRTYTGTQDQLIRHGLNAGGDVRSGPVAGGTAKASGTVFSNFLNWGTISQKSL